MNAVGCLKQILGAVLLNFYEVTFVEWKVTSLGPHGGPSVAPSMKVMVVYGIF